MICREMSRVTQVKPFNKMSDVDLVERIRSGCIESFETIFKRYKYKVTGIAFKILKDREDAYECAVDALFKAYNKIHTFRGDCKFSSWIYRITFNESLMRLRSQKSRNLTFVDTSPEELKRLADKFSITIPKNNIDDELIINSIGITFKTLPKQYSEIVYLKHFHDLTSNDISARLNLTIPAVKSRLNRGSKIAKKKLRRLYKEIAA